MKLLRTILLGAISLAAIFPAASVGQETDPKLLGALDEDVATIEKRAQTHFGSTYGGLWVAPGADVAEGLYVAFTDDAASALKVVAAGTNLENVVRPVAVDRSLSELLKIQGRAISFREELQESADLTENDPANRISVSIDQSANQVLVDVPYTAKVAVEEVDRSFGEGVRVQSSLPAGPECAGRFHCGSLLRSGLEIRKANNFPCSTAFTVARGSATQLLTAGHCGGLNTQWFHTGVASSDLFGSVQARQYYGNVDAARMSVGNGFSSLPRNYRTHADNNFPVSGTGTYAGLPENAQICKSGATTDQTCGIVLQKYHIPPWINGGNNFVKTSYCAEGGDSGGGVYRGEFAAGVHAGSTDFACSNPQSWATFSHIEFIQSALGVTVKTIP